MDSCNHVFIVRGTKYIYEKCGDVFNIGDFAKNKVEFDECPSGRCTV